MEQCIVCLEYYDYHKLILSMCKCVYICNDCHRIKKNNLVCHDYYCYDSMGLMYCSYNCIFNRIISSNNFDSYVYNIHVDNYYGYVYRNQIKLLNECKYQHYFNKLNAHVIPDLTKIICDYLIEN